jgi:hypothetical protein
MSISPGKVTAKPFSLLVPQIHAVGLTTRKSRGEAAEAAFLAKATSLGFGVAKPWGDSERYDFILDSGHKFWRVQIKSTQRYTGSRYQVKNSGWRTVYTARDIDFLIAYITPEDLWYVVPVAAIASRQHLRFYPHGGRKAQLEKYREAWCQLACPRDPDGPSQILVPRPCNGARIHGDCPLCG